MIKHLRDVRGENIDWIAMGKRFQSFRCDNSISQLEAAQAIGLNEPTIVNLEKGFCSGRKATNIIWNISLRWNLSINWLLNGIGKPHDPDPLELMPETLHVQKGAGIRRNKIRVEAEEGEYANEIFEFVVAIDKFKLKHKIPFPSLTQVYEIVIALGYRKSVPARIAPLGHIVQHQQFDEQNKQIKEKTPPLTDYSDSDGCARQEIALIAARKEQRRQAITKRVEQGWKF